MGRNLRKIRPKPAATTQTAPESSPPRSPILAFRLFSPIRHALIALAIGILPVTALAGDLAGRWQFIAETSDGRLAAQVTFIPTEGKTQAWMSIDGHILEGHVHGSPSGFTLELHDREEPGDSAHNRHLSLKGKLTGEELGGTWNDGVSQGTWTAQRE